MNRRRRRKSKNDCGFKGKGLDEMVKKHVEWVFLWAKGGGGTSHR